jgi:RNA polymerase sigma-70 factor (ECF subfamily)
MVQAAPLADPMPPPASAVEPADRAPPGVRELVERHADFVWRSLRRLGVPASLTDDATQRVFLAAAAKLDRLRPGCERAFLFGTLSRVAANVRRSRQRSREVAWEATQEPADPDPQPDELVANRQARALLDEALDALPDELRAVFVLSELEELTAPEVAELTGLPVGTVASRLRRAREEFQKAAQRLRVRLARTTPRRP